MREQAGALPTDDSFSDQFGRRLEAVERRLGIARGGGTMDVLFLAYLEAVARFGYVTLGPITIDVHLIAEIVERTAARAPELVSQDFVRFSHLLMDEVRRSGRRRIDELHYLFAFMRCREGLPARVFGELGVTPEDVERALQASPTERGDTAALEPLMTPEEVAAYLKVNVQTVRGWIRSGRLPARRVAGLRALRVRAADVLAQLQPLDLDDDGGGGSATASPEGR